MWCRIPRESSRRAPIAPHEKTTRRIELPTAAAIRLYHSQAYRPGGSAMRRLLAVLAGLAVFVFLGAPALAHHSQAMFDTSKEILIKGTVTRLEWKNPHIYLIVETVGPDGKR